jgi:hypothetical protein
MAFMDPLDLVVVMMQVLMCQDLGIHLWYLKVLVLSTPTRRETVAPTSMPTSPNFCPYCQSNIDSDGCSHSHPNIDSNGSSHFYPNK